jgi:protein SCO1/2
MANHQRPMALLVAMALAFAVGAHAQLYSPPESAGPAAGQKPAILNNVGLDQKLNNPLPLDATFRDERGNPVVLKQFFNGKPAILTLVYYQCPMLCTEVLNGLSSAIAPLKYDLGKDYQIITISIDPTETPAIAEAKKEKYIQRYGRAGAGEGWHFLTGDKPNIDAVASAVGFRYAYDANIKQYAHPSTIMLVTSDGHVAQYYTGIEYEPKDLRLGLTEASDNKIGTVVDRALLFCYHYDPTQGRYTPKIMMVVRAGGVLTVAAMGLMLFALMRGEKHKREKAA